jgi:hypothetical protein
MSSSISLGRSSHGVSQSMTELLGFTPGRRHLPAMAALLERNAQTSAPRHGRRTCGWRLCAALATAILCLCSISKTMSQPGDPLGTVNKYGLPIPSPSLVTTPQTFVLGGTVYVIPRNYVFGAEKDKSGSIAAISMMALLPDLSAVTVETMHCMNVRDSCFERLVVFGLTEGPTVASGPAKLRNIAPITQPDEKPGLCGLHYFQTKGLDQNALQFFFSGLGNDPDVSMARCPKNGSRLRCDADADVGDGNSFYYVFTRENLCSWAKIRDSIVELIASFRKAGEIR